MTVKKHLTLSQRIIIENGLREGKKINRIARKAVEDYRKKRGE